MVIGISMITGKPLNGVIVLFCWRPAVMASALSVAFRTLFTCLFIFMFGFCAKNKFFFFFNVIDALSKPIFGSKDHHFKLLTPPSYLWNGRGCSCKVQMCAQIHRYRLRVKNAGMQRVIRKNSPPLMPGSRHTRVIFVSLRVTCD